jgi:hypothetical protein
MKNIISYQNFTLLSCLSSVIVAFLLQTHLPIFGYMGLSGFFVADTLAMQSSLFEFVQDDSVKSVGTFGVYIVYYMSYYFGNLYNLLVNILFLLISSYYFYKICEVLNVSEKNRCIASGFVYSNLYLISVLFHPNKEISLIMLTNIYIYIILSNANLIYCFVVGLLAAMVRDAYGVSLILLLLIIYIDKYLKGAFTRNYFPTSIAMLAIFSLVTIDFVTLFPVGDLLLGIISRNVEYGESLDSMLSGLPSYLGFLLKVVNNYASGALRPQLLDINLRLNIVGIGLWQLGLLVLIGLPSTFKIRDSDNKLHKEWGQISIFSMFILCVISFGSFTQPRYMFPLINILSLAFVLRFGVGVRILYYLFTMLLVVIFFMLGLGVSLPEVNDLYPCMDGGYRLSC